MGNCATVPEAGILLWYVVDIQSSEMIWKVSILMVEVEVKIICGFSRIRILKDVGRLCFESVDQ